MSKFKVGDKVIPIRKGTGIKWDQWKEWCKEIGVDVEFLYVIHFACGKIICSTEKESKIGDYFLEEDLIPYVEKEKPKKIISTFKVKDIVELLSKGVLKEDDEVYFSRK